MTRTLFLLQGTAVLTAHLTMRFMRERAPDAGNTALHRPFQFFCDFPPAQLQPRFLSILRLLDWQKDVLEGLNWMVMDTPDRYYHTLRSSGRI